MSEEEEGYLDHSGLQEDLCSYMGCKLGHISETVVSREEKQQGVAHMWRQVSFCL